MAAGMDSQLRDDVIADVRFIDGVSENETGREATGLRTAVRQI